MIKFKLSLILLTLIIVFNLKIHAQGDLDNGIYYGYQAWHLAPGDGRTRNPDLWEHWFDAPKTISTADKLGIEFYPEMSEYTVTYDTDMLLPNGGKAKLYSCYDYETIDLHVKWMKQYGIKGFFLQRQQLNIQNNVQKEFRDEIVRHVIKACEKYSIKFCMMPANNDKNQGGQQFVDKVITDWKHCVDDLKVLESPMYIKQTNKEGIMLPVIGFWGLGFSNRPIIPDEAIDILNFYQSPTEVGENSKYRVYVMGGIPARWREEDNFSDWQPVYNKLDMISPWRTIFGNPNSKANIARMEEDLAYCESRGIDYNPVVAPGASAATQQNNTDLRNWKKREGGKFLWDQVVQVTKMNTNGPKFMYAAMFDEVDEGTAFYKMVKTVAEAPVGTRSGFEIVTLDEDGYDLPSDWYLRLAGEAQKMFDGTIPFTETIPIDPDDDYELHSLSTNTINKKFIKQSYNYPNPFKDKTTITFELVENSKISINVYTIKGQLVQTILKNENKSAGTQSINWNRKNSDGTYLNAGVYIYTIHGESLNKSFTQSHTMILK